MLDEIAAEIGGHDAPVLEYARLRAQITDLNRSQARASRLHRRQAASDALAALRRGDIITITHGRRGGLAVVLESARDRDDPRPLVLLTEHRWAGRISSADYSGTTPLIGTMTLPKRVEHRQPRVRRDLASALLSAAEGLAIPKARRDKENAHYDPELASAREQLRRHPLHNSPGVEEQVRQAERYLRIERDNAQLERKVAAATNSLARTFDRIVGLLTEREFIQGPADDPRVTDDGRLLARIYSESDLLVAECLRTGAWAGLKPPSWRRWYRRCSTRRAAVTVRAHRSAATSPPRRCARRCCRRPGCRRRCGPTNKPTGSRRAANPTTASCR